MQLRTISLAAQRVSCIYFRFQAVVPAMNSGPRPSYLDLKAQGGFGQLRQPAIDV